MEIIVNPIVTLTNNCLLCKLSREFHGNEDHSEYLVRNKKIKESFPKLISLLESENLEIDSNNLAHLLILYLELESDGPWNTEHTKHMEHSEELNKILKNRYNVDLFGILLSDQFNSQEIFDVCIKLLHMKMTANEFKKYPSLIEVYCLLLKDVKNCKIHINPVTVLPVALLLIEDYVPANKVKGLKSCANVLQCLTIEDFTNGNYYEVVYSSLKKNVVEKDKEVTQALFECFMVFLNVLPPNIKKIKLDDIFSSMLDQLYTETNLYRKADCFDFVSKIIEMHGIHCVKKKIFKDIIYDNIEICSNEGVSEILLLHVLECLETWIRYCWCIWKLATDQKIVSALFKILYLSKEDTIKLKIQNLIIALIKLCAKDEQEAILEGLEEPLAINNEDFISRVQIIKGHIND